MAKKRPHANITAMIYEHGSEIMFDCVGEQNCAHVRYLLQPPDKDEECCCKTEKGCVHPMARKLALEAMKYTIEIELLRLEDE